MCVPKACTEGAFSEVVRSLGNSIAQLDER